MTAITTMKIPGYEVGDTVFVDLRVPDPSRLKRLWRFVTFRKPPMKTERYAATVTSATTLSVPAPRDSGRKGRPK